MIPNDTIERIKTKATVSKVIGASVTLKKDGSNYKGLCPFHNEKTPSFTVSDTKGIYKCFGCGKSGDAIAFVMEKDNKSYIEALQWMGNLVGIEVKEEEKKKAPVKPQPRLEKLNRKFIDWFQTRGISNDTLLRMKLTEAIEWMPQFEKEVLAVCFNYYRGDDLVNIKFRGPQKSFKLAKDAELIFYNLNALEGEKTAVIVEGEIDCLSCVESGVYNSVSVPNGAGAGNQKLEYLDNCYQAFSGLEKIILAVDNDAPGRNLRDELGRRLGIERCFLVDYPEGCKDLNNVLITHGKEKVREVIENARPWPLKGVMTMEEMYDTVSDWYHNGYPTGAKTRIPGFDQFLTFAPGQLTVITGIPGHGKDEFSNYIMSALAFNEQWVWGVCGFEETPPETVTKLQEKLTHKAFGFRKFLGDRMNQNQFDWSIGFIDQFFKIINPDDVETDIDSLLKLATQLVVRFGIRGLYLNPWNWIEHNRQAHVTETEHISQSLSKIIRWARRHGVHVILLAHTTKIGKDKDGKFIIPNLYSINGSANFYNKTHNGITVYRDYQKGVTDIYIQKVKQSWYGQIGFVTYSFNTMTRQYEFFGSSLVEKEEVKQSWAPVQLPYADDKPDETTDEEPF